MLMRWAKDIGGVYDGPRWLQKRFSDQLFHEGRLDAFPAERLDGKPCAGRALFHPAH
jgi:hypothetical protein